MESEWLRWGQKSSIESSIGAFYCGPVPEEHPQQFCSLDISNSNFCSLMYGGTKIAVCYLRINKLTFFFQYMLVSSTMHLLQHSKSYLKKTIWKDYLKRDKLGCSLICLEQIQWTFESHDKKKKKSSTESAVSHFRSAESVLGPTTCPFKSDSELSSAYTDWRMRPIPGYLVILIQNTCMWLIHGIYLSSKKVTSVQGVSKKWYHSEKWIRIRVYVCGMRQTLVVFEWPHLTGVAEVLLF